MLSLQLMNMSMLLLPMITMKYMWVSSTALVMSLLPMFMILMNDFSYVMNSSFMASDLMSSSLSILTVWVTAMMLMASKKVFYTLQYPKLFSTNLILLLVILLNCF